MAEKPSVFDIYTALRDVDNRWFEFGLNVGIPRRILDQYKLQPGRLNAVIEFWHRGNADGGPPVTWQSVVDTLRRIDEHGLAKELQSKVVGLTVEIPPFSEDDQSHKLKELQSKVVDLTVEEDEIPRFSEDDQKSEFESHKPEPPPRDRERVSELKHFCNKVKYLILTFNPNEYQAATTYMKPPSQNFNKPIVYPYPEMVVGIFGESGIKVALVWASQGDKVVEDIKLSCESYRNIEYIIAAGVCYAFSRKDFKFADVLISEKIADFSNTKILVGKDGKLACENRGERREIDPYLERIFCKDLTVPPYFVALGKEDKKERYYKAKAGIIITPSLLVDNKEFRDALHAAEPKAIGGEMEGGKLMSSVFSRCFVDHQLKGVIVVKGVCDYADGFKDKRWQFTAAKAALHYIEEKMRYLSE